MGDIYELFQQILKNFKKFLKNNLTIPFSWCRLSMLKKEPKRDFKMKLYYRDFRYSYGFY